VSEAPVPAAPTVPAAVPDARRMMDTLAFVTELAQVTASNFELQPILDWIVARTTELLGADEGCLRLATAADPSGRTQSFKRDSGSGSWPPQVAISVMGYVPYREPWLATADLLADARFPSLRLTGGASDEKIARFRAMLAAPLAVEGRVTGLIAVTEAKPGRQWTPSDVQLLSIVAGSSAGAIEKAQLREAAVIAARREEEMKRREAEQKAIEREMAQARDIQMSLVPSRPLTLGDWEILGRVLPARQVGGDGFLYFPIAGGERLGFAIADVSGKGAAAAVLMANVQGALSEVCNRGLPIPEAIAHINAGVARKSSGKFVTLFYGEFDPATRRLRYTNAGHNYPLLRRAAGEVEELKDGGLPLGMFDETAYVEGEVTLGAGDALMLYSDGITEAINPARDEYGEERLIALWRELGAGPAAAFIDRLFAEVESFRGSAAQSDDMTVVVLHAPRPA
jgi:phosphoserine phosphatase RsbU/P